MKKTALKIIIPIAAVLATVIIAAIVCVVIFIFTPRSGQQPGYPDETGYEDGWTYYYRENNDWCVAVKWEWDGDPDNMTVTVPETLGGRTVTRLSSTDWAIGPFSIEIPEDMRVAGDENVVFEGFDGESTFEDKEYETYSFTVVLNPNIEEVACKDTYSGVLLEDDTEDVLYYIDYNFTMNGDSEYLDIVDGEPVRK